jgi:FtsZ-binding cell division protein ZapB
MSESLWKSDAVEEAQPEEPGAGPDAESGALTMSADDFSALEERIMRAVEMVKRERLARAEAEKRADAADARLREAAPLTENLQKEVSALRGEREQVRQRVERLLSQLDALEL